MIIKDIINDYTETNNFEIRYINNQILIYYYDKIKNFSSDKIEILNKDSIYIITGKNLIIKEMNEIELTISGVIAKIEMKSNE